MSTRGATEDAKRRLLRAGERLFAEQGIHRVRLRELHELAGQRNASALHYHFGTRNGLVNAIIAEHWTEIDEAVEGRLDAIALNADPDVREVLEAVVPVIAAKLLDESGRRFLRILPQLLPQISRNYRGGRFVPATSQTTRILGLLERTISSQPEAIRRERLIAYALVLITVLADRAEGVDRGHDMVLDHETFVANLIDVLTGALTHRGSSRNGRRSLAGRGGTTAARAKRRS